MRRIAKVKKNYKQDELELKRLKRKADHTFDNYRYYTCREGEDPLKVRSFMTYVVTLEKGDSILKPVSLLKKCLKVF